MPRLLPHLNSRIAILVTLVLLMALPVQARNPIKNAFFSAYPGAAGTRLADLPSNSNHCGVCHFDFDGGGTRNPYGLSIQVAIDSGQYGSDLEAILAVENDDSDNDGHSNLVEITDTVNFSNTPTFPGLTAGNLGSVSNVDPAHLVDYLTPSGGSDTTPPSVTVISPNGGESIAPNGFFTVSWSADDPSGIVDLAVFLSDDGGLSFKPVGRGLPDTGSWSWFVSNLPGTDNRIKVVARDGAGNLGDDLSNTSFTVEPWVGGLVPTTLRDFDLPGTQPLEAGILEDPTETCVTCHGDYNHAVEPMHNWRGGMMGQAMRDPLFLATMVVAEQDAPASGDLCLRCHTPGGWQEGRSADTSGGQLTPKDREGVQCDFCHRMVDPHYEEGISPFEDLAILNILETIPLTTANGQFINDPDPMKRGPYADAQADHQFLESPFHLSGDLCGTCHDVSNPVFVQGASPAEYWPNDMDTEHPDGDLRNMFPVERTFSEWTQSEYAASGVYAPQFAGNKPDGMVSTCQDCHMRDVAGKGAVDGPVRSDLGLHDLTGGNYFVPDIIAEYFPDEVDEVQLQDGKLRAMYMLSLAATMELTQIDGEGQPAAAVKVTNETGHKLPSGYPEGRRIWVNVKAYDESSNLVYESGAYDPATGVLDHDEDLKIYHIESGISERLGAALGIEAGPSLKFVMSDSVYFDNRIPPRGFTYANFEAVQSPPVGYAYADYQYWDETVYQLPAEASFVEAILYYQSTSKEYIEFLRDTNVTNDLGQRLYDSWVAQGRAAPVVMVSQSLLLDETSIPGQTPEMIYSLGQNSPNPFNPVTTIEYNLAHSGPVLIRVFDLQGRLQRVLVDDVQGAGLHATVWNGRDDLGRRLSSGVYMYQIEAGTFRETRKMLLLK